MRPASTSAPAGATSGWRRRAALVVTAAVAVAVDLVSKAWATSALASRGIDLPGPLDLQLAYNRGVAFSLFEGLPAAVTITVTGVLTVVLAAGAWREFFPLLPAGLILGGALANLLDRLGDGKVVDLLHTGWWPTFNLADAFITVGCAALLLASFGTDERPG